jgi:HD-like signal output (HDOD) protein
MTIEHFRLTIQRLLYGAHLQQLTLYLQNDLDLREETIRAILSKPPRVVLDHISQNEAEQIQQELEKLGCLSEVEGLHSLPKLPYLVPHRTKKTISKELSKTLRYTGSLALYVVEVYPKKNAENVPSLQSASFLRSVENSFRESDTIVSINDTSFVLLGFHVDRKGTLAIRSKLAKLLPTLIGNNIEFSIGLALFPEDAQRVEELLVLADRNKSRSHKTEIPSNDSKEKPRSSSESRVTQEEEEDIVQDCFASSRGINFQRLLDMEPITIWSGLTQLSRSEQKIFLDRLPYNSSLLAGLKKLFSSPPKRETDKISKPHLEAVICQMDLTETLEQRKHNQEFIKTKLSWSEDLPTLPSIAMQVFQITSNPNFSPADLSALIENDPSLTAKILKTVNSPFYGIQQEVGTVQQAVILLGSDEIVDMAFGMAASEVFDIESYPGVIDPKALWRHSICTALISQYLCKKSEECKNFGAFTAGLLHDVGKIFFIKHLPQLYQQIHTSQDEQSLPLFEMEEDTLGVNHAAIGGFLISKWNLPQPLIQATGFHHQPAAAPKFSQLAALVGLADYIHWQVMVNFQEQLEEFHAQPRLSFGHYRLLTNILPGFNKKALPSLIEEIQKFLEDSEDILSVLE